MKGRFVMQFFNFRTSKNKEDIIWKFNSLRAVEKHRMIFIFFDRYNDNRIGLHTYVNGNIVKGYYENGGFNRSSLGNSKVWFYGKLVEREGTCQFRGIIFSSFILIELYMLIQLIIYRDFIWLMVCLGYISYLMRKEETMYECLEEIMS